MARAGAGMSTFRGPTEASMVKKQLLSFCTIITLQAEFVVAQSCEQPLKHRCI